MLGELFYWLLNMSILGTIVGLVILALHKIKKFPSNILYLFWSIPLIRFWIPLGFGSKYSLMSLLAKLTKRTVVVYENVNPSLELTMMNSIMAAESYDPLVYKTNLLENVFAWASIAWSVIFAVIILTSLLLYYFTKAEMKDAEHYKDNIYLSDKITSPAVYGIWNPRIILPNTISKEDMPYILLHEGVHIKRRDNLWRVVAIITACLHWFNPFAWVFLKLFLADMELSCDADVLIICGEEKRKEYAIALVNCEANKTVFASAFGGAKTRVRIESILSYKKLTVFSSMCFAALMIILFITLLTNAAI